MSIEFVQFLNAHMMHLQQVMLEKHVAVHAQNQPLRQILHRINAVQLQDIMQQYALFAKELFHFTERAYSEADAVKWPTVSAELADNVAEELGRCTAGVPHHVLLAQGLEAAFQMPIQLVPTATTQTLLDQLDRMFDQSFAYVLGAIYAIEATSIPELEIVWQSLQQVLGVLPDRLNYFFTMHLNEWEPEHEKHLRTAIAQDLSIAEIEQFTAGFQAILMAFDQWWQEIAMEVILQKVDLRMRTLRNQAQPHSGTSAQTVGRII